MVLSSTFSDMDAARKYFLPYWEPEPGPEVSDEVYWNWEDRNPIWSFAEEVGMTLDPSLVEVVSELDGVTAQMSNNADILSLQQSSNKTPNTFFFIVCSTSFPDDAVHHFELSLCSKKVSFLGVFDFNV